MAFPQIEAVGASLKSPTLQPWSCCARSPGAITHPDQLAAGSDWLPAEVPGTAAAALEATGRWHLGAPYDFDAEDWWFRTAFDSPGSACHLRFDGLATLAEIWLNGVKLMTTDNMFRTYGVDITSHVCEQNELVLGFRSLSADLQKKRTRPRWKTNLVSHQQLRWQRTSLLGRMPGWSPPVAAVGPWRAVHLDLSPFRITDWRLTTRLDGCDGVVMLSGRLTSVVPIVNCRLKVAEQTVSVETQEEGENRLLRGELGVARPSLWWPHTHGGQPLFPCTVELNTEVGDFVLHCGKVGFRRFEVSDSNFGIMINDVPIYCRGACWTVSDIVRPGTGASLDQDLRLLRESGANMLRVGGTMVHESGRFHELCDELGILVWQDFMFANMDYPVEDPAFAANIEAEACEQLARLASHPSLAVLCGNSEVEQQAAMRGVARELWRNAWFDGQLRTLCHDYCPTAAFVPSTPSGGDMPFHVGTGIAHYYGVGAYQRVPLELRRADVKFAAECLGFAQIPEPDTVDRVMEGSLPVLHDPRWKQRVPRDTGAGWDFDDVRDFYLQHLFAVDPVKLRCFDMPRYLQLSRVVPGEMMSQVFAEWRSCHGRNRGGLVWFYKDLWPGAGWGIIDSQGIPKAAYYYLKRIWRPRQVTITDEGMDGLHLHIINETAEPFQGKIELVLLQDGYLTVARGEAACEVPARGQRMYGADALLGGFFDVNYAYRFGPARHDLVSAALLDDQGQVISEGFHFVRQREPAYLTDVKLEVTAETVAENRVVVRLQTDRFLHGVHVEAKGFLPDDNYFHLLPGRAKTVGFTARQGAKQRFRICVQALNLKTPVVHSLRA